MSYSTLILYKYRLRFNSKFIHKTQNIYDYIEPLHQIYPVIISAPMDVGACNGYNGPDFHSSLPNRHEYVTIIGRFQLEWNEAPGGLTEIHADYAIKTIPTI